MESKFESLIGLHCAPTIMGIKPANLFSWQNSYDRATPCLDEIISTYKNKFDTLGISLEILCKCKRHTLVYLYRDTLLQEHLHLKKSQEILIKYNYKESATIRELINSLKEHLRGQKNFPHEIGLFLGYPPEDVIGFIENNGKKCKLCGEWKVYGETNRAKNLFDRYKDCRNYLCEKISGGTCLSEIINEINTSSNNIGLLT
ncbi:MAG: DUF3793 family protein [Synergistaceae bacterium]